MATITKDELNSLQQAINKVNEAKAILGDVHTQAHYAQLEVLKHNEALLGIQKGLESKYGAITVDIQTGEYTEEAQEAQEE